MSGHTTFIKKCFDEKEVYRREVERLRIEITKVQDLHDEILTDVKWLLKSTCWTSEGSIAHDTAKELREKYGVEI